MDDNPHGGGEIRVHHRGSEHVVREGVLVRFSTESFERLSIKDATRVAFGGFRVQGLICNTPARSSLLKRVAFWSTGYESSALIGDTGSKMIHNSAKCIQDDAKSIEF